MFQIVDFKSPLSSIRIFFEASFEFTKCTQSALKNVCQQSKLVKLIKTIKMLFIQLYTTHAQKKMFEYRILKRIMYNKKYYINVH